MLIIRSCAVSLGGGCRAGALVRNAGLALHALYAAEIPRVADLSPLSRKQAPGDFARRAPRLPGGLSNCRRRRPVGWRGGWRMTVSPCRPVAHQHVCARRAATNGSGPTRSKRPGGWRASPTAAYAFNCSQRKASPLPQLGPVLERVYGSAAQAGVANDRGSELKSRGVVARGEYAIEAVGKDRPVYPPVTFPALASSGRP